MQHFLVNLILFLQFWDGRMSITFRYSDMCILLSKFVDRIIIKLRVKYIAKENSFVSEIIVAINSWIYANFNKVKITSNGSEYTLSRFHKSNRVSCCKMSLSATRVYRGANAFLFRELMIERHCGRNDGEQPRILRRNKNCKRSLNRSSESVLVSHGAYCRNGLAQISFSPFEAAASAVLKCKRNGRFFPPFLCRNGCKITFH